MIQPFLNAIGSIPLLWVLISLVVLVAAYWMAYRMIRRAVCNGIKSAGLGGAGHEAGPSDRLHQDPKYDFVYTQPRH